MSRQNENLTAKEIEELATKLLDVGIRVKNVATRMNEEKVKSLNLAHLSTIEGGLLAVRKFAREANTKIDNELDERTLRRRRASEDD